MTKQITSNQYWGGLNRRFDKRAAILRKLGFKYQRIDAIGTAVFACGVSRVRSISVSILHLASNREWISLLSNTLRHYPGLSPSRYYVG